jgi:hypothetical protein
MPEQKKYSLLSMFVFRKKNAFVRCCEIALQPGNTPTKSILGSLTHFLYSKTFFFHDKCPTTITGQVSDGHVCRVNDIRRTTR